MPSDKQAFVVRIWKEAAEIPEDARWRRGSFDDAGSGVCACFRHLDESSDVIQRKLAAAVDGTDHALDMAVIKADHEQ